MSIVYLDTSSLVKLYVSETGSSQITRLVSESSAVVTSMIAYFVGKQSIFGDN